MGGSSWTRSGQRTDQTGANLRNPLEVEIFPNVRPKQDVSRKMTGIQQATTIEPAQGQHRMYIEDEQVENWAKIGYQTYKSKEGEIRAQERSQN